jgi:hypothetical protein
MFFYSHEIYINKKGLAVGLSLGCLEVDAKTMYGNEANKQKML